MYEYIIIGAGVTGLTLCKKFREAGISDILVLEADNRVGGLCKTEEIDGHKLDIGGGHFFHTKHPEVFEYIFSLLSEDKFRYYKRISKIEFLESETESLKINRNSKTMKNGFAGNWEMQSVIIIWFHIMRNCGESN